MAKKKTPEQEILAKSREELLPYFEHPPEGLVRDAYSRPQRSADATRPAPTATGWSRVHALLAGLEGVIPPERFASINEALQSVDALTIMVQNLQQTSRADVLSTKKRGAGGAAGGRGHKKDGSGDQATDADIDAALDAVTSLGQRKLVKRIVLDAMSHLHAQGKRCSESKVRDRRLERIGESKSEPKVL